MSINISSVQVQPGVVYNNSVLILLSKPVTSSSDSYINIAQIIWMVSKVAMATSPTVLYYNKGPLKGNLFVLVFH